jgi:cytoskeletal protein RodZ
MITSKEIGKIFSEARQEKGMSRDEASEKSRIHPNVIKDIETGVFDRLGKTYLRSFLKKYAVFLGLNPEGIIQKYESISAQIPGREFSLSEDHEKGSPIDDLKALVSDKRAQTILAGVLSLILVVLVLVLIGKMKDRFSSETVRVTAKAAPKKIETKPVVKETPKKAEPVAEKPAEKSSFFTKSAQSKQVELTLKARGEAWIQVMNGPEKVFVGTLKKGETKTWKGEGTFTVWTGKGDMLDFYVNGRKIGVVAAGVVKNIEVSSEGIKIGDVWVARLQ